MIAPVASPLHNTFVLLTVVVIVGPTATLILKTLLTQPTASVTVMVCGPAFTFENV